MENLWVTGYRNYELNIFDDQDKKLTVVELALKQALTNVLNDGLKWIITGAQLGTEQWTIQLSAKLKTDYPELQVAAMLPFMEFGKNWNEKNQVQLEKTLALADFSQSTSKQPYQSGQQLRMYQQFMMDHTDGALLLYDPEHPGKPKYDYEAITKYQEGHDYDLTMIDMYDLEDISQDLQENLW